MATAVRTCRILYYGPAGSGKRENLARIQASLPAEHRLAVATQDPSRQIAFMLRNGNQGDWQIFVQALDSGHEGPVASGTSIPFDGVVFVCDSRLGGLDEGLSAMEGLKSYLDCWRLDIMAVPMVLQYNKRDGEGVLPVDRLESLLNPWGLLSFPAASATSEGVRETLKAILSLTISSVLQRQGPQTNGTGAAEEGLEIDTGPPVPGNQHAPAKAAPPQSDPAPPRTPEPSSPTAPRQTGAASSGIMVIPVRVPRHALGPDGTGRILLEVQITDD